MEKNIKQKVIKYFKGKGFNCLVQKEFPNILIWKPFIDDAGRTLSIRTQIENEDKIYQQNVIPYFVSFVQCSKLNKKDKIKAKKILKEGRGNSFLIASENKNKLKFEEITSKQEIELKKDIKKDIPFYLR